MKKILLYIAFIFCFINSFGQPVVNRAAGVVTVKDAREMAGLNLFIPVYADTVEANLANNIGIDSTAAIIFTRDFQTCWIRGYSPKRWIVIGAGGAGGSLNNLGVGFRFGVQGTSNIKTFFPGFGALLDSTSNANALTLTVDSTKFYLYSNPLHFLTDTSLVASVLYPLYPFTSTILAIDTGAGRPANKTYVTTRSLVDSLISVGGGGGTVTGANNGVSLSGANVQLGRAVGGTGADLTAEREIPVGTTGIPITLLRDVSGTIPLFPVVKTQFRLGNNISFTAVDGGYIAFDVLDSSGNSFGGMNPGLSYYSGANFGTLQGSSGLHWFPADKHFDIIDLRGSLTYAAIQGGGTSRATFFADGRTFLSSTGVQRVSIASVGSATPGQNLNVYGSTYLSDSLLVNGILTGGSSDSVLVISSTKVVKKVLRSSFVNDANNGLTDSVGRVVMGGSVYKNTTFQTHDYLIQYFGEGAPAGLGLMQINATVNGALLATSPLTAISGFSTGSGVSSIGVSGISAGGPALEGTTTGSSTNDVISIMNLTRNTSGTAANGIGGKISFSTFTDAVTAQLSNELISKWTVAANATRTSQFDITGVSSATTQTFMNIQTGGIVRVNNLADTLSTKAYARSVGGSGGSSLLPVAGTGTATGNIIGSLATFTLDIKQGSNSFININPTAGSEQALIQAFNTTGDGNYGEFVGGATNTSAIATLQAVFDDGTKTAGLVAVADATTSTLTATATTTTITSDNATGTTTSAGHVVGVNSLTTGTGQYIASSSMTSGNLLNIVSTSTALAANNEGLNIAISGANGTNAITATGGRISVTNTNATSGTNIALELNGSGATTGNYGLDVIGGTSRFAGGLALAAGTPNFAQNGGYIYFNSGTNTLMFDSRRVSGGYIPYDMNFVGGIVSINSGTGGANMFYLNGTGLKIGNFTAPTALLTLAAGTASANTAPLKLIAGTNLTTPEAGAIEFDGKDLFFTPAGTIRKVIPTIISSRATAQTAANASVATQTVGASDASYFISANVLVTTSSAEAFTVTVAYTDEGNTARTQTMPFVLLAGTTVAAINFSNGAVPYEGVIIQIRAKASTTITVATTGTFTGATYNVEGTISKIQ